MLLSVVGAVVLLVVVGSVAARATHGTSPRCVYACAPPSGVAQPEGSVYTSPLGFSFAYPGGWQQTKGQGSTVEFQSHSGDAYVLIASGSGTPPLTSLLQAGEQNAQSNFQQVALVGSLPGAAMGSVPGAGVLYGGYADVNGQQNPVRIAVIAAEHDGHYAILIGASIASAQAAPTGVLEGAAFDDVLTQWNWGSA